MKNPTAAKIRRIVRAIERQDLGELGSLLETEVKINQEISRGGTEKRVTMLSIAAGESALAMVRYLLDRGADPDKGKFLPPLIAAVQRDSLKVAELLVEAGANVNITAKFNGDPSPDYDRDSEWTPLMSAVVVGNTKIVDLLLREGADPNLTTRLGRSALDLAVYQGNVQIAQKLLSAGCKRFGSALTLGTSRGESEMIRVLLQAGADPNVRGVAAKGEIPHTPLERAVAERTTGNRLKNAAQRKRYFEVVKELIDGGARVNEPTEWCSPLYLAAAAGDVEMVRLLLSKGADPNAVGGALRSESGRRPLHAAALDGSTDVIRVLLSAGADPNVGDSRCRTPLQLVLRQEKSPEVEIIRMTMHHYVDGEARLADAESTWKQRREKVMTILRKAENESAWTGTSKHKEG